MQDWRVLANVLRTMGLATRSGGMTRVIVGQLSSLSWYQSGATCQSMLPEMGYFLGHIHISWDSAYLLDSELLQKASHSASNVMPLAVAMRTYHRHYWGRVRRFCSNTWVGGQSPQLIDLA